MASLLRNSRSILTRFSLIHRTATTVAANAGTQVKTAGNLAVRDAQQRLAPSDAIKPRAAGESPLIPLVGKALNTPGQIALGVVLAISAYFIYINYVINPEFYKSLKVSREASKRDSHQQSSANHEGTAGQKH